MNYDDYLKQNPEFAARAKLSAHKYTCATCRKGFDKPKTKIRGSYHLILVLGILLIIAGVIKSEAEIGAVGIGCALIYAVFYFSGIGSKKVCPYCGSPYFTKNK